MNTARRILALAAAAIALAAAPTSAATSAGSGSGGASSPSTSTASSSTFIEFRSTGGQLLANGAPFYIKGINWFGFGACVAVYAIRLVSRDTD